jgi:hypothetical protein
LDLHDVSFLLAKTNEVGLRVAENTNNLAVLLHFLQVLFNDSLAFWLSPFLSVSRECLLLGASPSDKEVRMAHARLKLISNCERSFNPVLVEAPLAFVTHMLGKHS